MDNQTQKQTRIILKPMGFLIFATVPTLAVLLGFALQRSRGNAAAAAAPAAGQIVAESPAPAAAAAPVLLSADSPVRNGSFEEREGQQKPAAWDTALAGNNSAQVSYIESQNGARGGAYHLTHFGGSDYDVRTTQLLTGLKNGKYTLRAWARKNQGRNESYLVAKDFAAGEPKKVAPIPISETTYGLVEVKNVDVRNGQCLIGIYSKAAGGLWTFVDDVEFVPQGASH